MTTIGSTTSAAAAFRALTSMYEDMEQDVKEIADEIDSVVNFKKGIHDALNFLRQNDVTGLFAFLDKPENKELSDKFGARPSPTEDVPGTGKAPQTLTILPKVEVFGLKLADATTMTLPGSAPSKTFSKDQIEGMKDRLKDVGDEAGQVATKLQLRFQMKNQGKSEAFGAMSNSLKSEHDSAMTAVNNSKA